MKKIPIIVAVFLIGCLTFVAGILVGKRSVEDMEALNTCLLLSATADMNLLARFSSLLAEGRADDVSDAIPKLIDGKTSLVATALGAYSAPPDETRLALEEARTAKKKLNLSTEAIDNILARR